MSAKQQLDHSTGVWVHGLKRRSGKVKEKNWKNKERHTYFESG